MNNNTASTSTNASTHSIAQQTSERELTKQPFDSRTQAHLKVLIKLTRQNVKANHHIEILAKCVEEKRPPKGGGMDVHTQHFKPIRTKHQILKRTLIKHIIQGKE
jgi:hypothetical protein